MAGRGPGSNRTRRSNAWKKRHARNVSVTLILLPGLDGTGDFFQPLLEALGHTVRTRVVRYPLDGAYDYPTCRELVRAALPADAPYVLLGESFSGPIAISLAAEAPKGLAADILCATFATNPRPRLAFIRHLLPLIPFTVRAREYDCRGSWYWVGGSRRRSASCTSAFCPGCPAATLRARLLAVADCDAPGVAGTGFGSDSVPGRRARSADSEVSEPSDSAPGGWCQCRGDRRATLHTAVRT